MRFICVVLMARASLPRKRENERAAISDRSIENTKTQRSKSKDFTEEFKEATTTVRLLIVVFSLLSPLRRRVSRFKNSFDRRLDLTSRKNVRLFAMRSRRSKLTSHGLF